MTFAFNMSPGSPLVISRPTYLFPDSCSDRSATSTSMGSKPAFSASDLGMTSTASANACIASCSLPPTVAAYSRSLSASSISVAPPPATYLPSSTAHAVTRNASYIPRSNSSTTCSVPPRNNIDTDFGFWQFSTNIISSPPIFLSSTIPAFPRSPGLISSSVVNTLPPVALASFFMSLSFTRRTAITPAFAR